jgi:hypothetical protein
MSRSSMPKSEAFILELSAKMAVFSLLFTV